MTNEQTPNERTEPPIGSMWRGTFGDMQVVSIVRGKVGLQYVRLSVAGHKVYKRISMPTRTFYDPLLVFFRVWAERIR